MRKRICYLVVFAALAVVLQCSDPVLIEPTSNSQATGATYQTINPNDDAALMALLKDVRLRTRTGRAKGEGTIVQLDEAIKVTNPYRGITRYSLLIDDTTGNAFENLVIRQRGDTIYTYLLRYEPDTAWLHNLSGEFDTRTFTGTLQVMTTSRNVMQVVTFVQGQSTAVTVPDNAGSREDCNDDANPGVVSNPNPPTGSPGSGTGGGSEGAPKGGPDGTSSTGGLGGSTSGGSTIGSGSSGGGSNSGTSGASTGDRCSWSVSASTGGLIIYCPSRSQPFFFLRTRCAPKPFGDTNEEDANDDPIGVLPKTLSIAKINLDTSITNSPKANCIYNKLGGTETFQELIKDFSAEPSRFTLNFKLGDAPGKARAATTQERNYTLMTVVIDSVFLRTNNALLAAKSFLHEAIHAKLFADVGKAGSFDAIAEHNFVELWEAKNVLGYKPGTNATNNMPLYHHVMARYYVELMAQALRSFDQGSDLGLTMDHYRALAWEGLKETKAFEGLEKGQQEKILRDYQYVLELDSKVCKP